MKNFRANSLFLTFISLLLGFSCSKEPAVTTVKGRVVDGETGAYIVGATITGYLYKVLDKGEITGEVKFSKTDNQGYFSIDDAPEGAFFSSIVISKDGYVNKKIENNKFKKGISNDLGSLPMVPRNGFLNFSAINTTGQEKLWVIFYSKIVEIETAGTVSATKKTPVLMPKNSMYNELISTASNEYLYIFWGTNFNGYNQLKDMPHKDSVYMLRKDTVDFTIDY